MGALGPMTILPSGIVLRNFNNRPLGILGIMLPCKQDWDMASFEKTQAMSRCGKIRRSILRI